MIRNEIETEAPPEQGVTLADALRGLEWDARHGEVHTGRYRARYVLWGDGPPLVFVHGLGDSLHSFAMLMQQLSRDFTCIAYDQPTGRGDGARLRHYRHDHLVEDLYHLMDHLGVRQAPVLGYSFGSTIALRGMHTQPGRISRGLLLGGFAHRPLARAEYFMAWLGRYLVGSMGDLPLRAKVMERSYRPGFAHCEPEVWDFFLEHYGRSPIRAVGHWALWLHNTDLREHLPAVQQPVLLICGDRDPLVPHACQQVLFERLPNAQMYQIENCGHFPVLTHPGVLADAVRRFLWAPECVFGGPRRPGQVSLCNGNDRE